MLNLYRKHTQSMYICVCVCVLSCVAHPRFAHVRRRQYNATYVRACNATTPSPSLGPVRIPNLCIRIQMRAFCRYGRCAGRAPKMRMCVCVVLDSRGAAGCGPAGGAEWRSAEGVCDTLCKMPGQVGTWSGQSDRTDRSGFAWSIDSAPIEMTNFDRTSAHAHASQNEFLICVCLWRAQHEQARCTKRGAPPLHVHTSECPNQVSPSFVFRSHRLGLFETPGTINLYLASQLGQRVFCFRRKTGTCFIAKLFQGSAPRLCLCVRARS